MQGRGLSRSAVVLTALLMLACASPPPPAPTSTEFGPGTGSPAPLASAVEASVPAGSQPSAETSPAMVAEPGSDTKPSASAAPVAPPPRSPEASSPASPLPRQAQAAPGLPSATPPSRAPAPQPPSGGTEPRKAVKAALGEIVYTEGSVELRRGTSVLRGAEADIGAPVLAFDLIVTGSRSKAEIDLGSAIAGGGRIKVAERTAFYFDAKELDDGSRSSVIRLLAGSLALKVEKLGGGSFTIATGGAVLGVRGTTFSVDSAADGSLLVSCAEGRVAVRGPAGAEWVARPGSAVEAGGGGLGPRPIPAERLSTYRSAWLLDREAALLRGGAPLAASLASALEAARPAFQTALAALRAEEPVLGAWERGLASGREYRFSEGLAEKKAVASALLACLKALPAFETPYYRLAELSERRADGLALGGALPRTAPSLEALFASFQASRPENDRAFGELRRALSLFARVAGDSPLGEFFGERSSLQGGGGSLLDFGF